MTRLRSFPDPLPHDGTRDPEVAAVLKHVDCRTYGHCLSVADRERWAAFSCGACKAFRRITEAQRLKDVAPILTCLAEAWARELPGYRGMK